MNNLQWTVLFLVAFVAIGMIWFAKTYIPSINIGPKVTYVSTPNLAVSDFTSDNKTGPEVVIIGSKKSGILPVYKESFTPLRNLEAYKINYRIQNGRKVLAFSDNSEIFLTDDEYKQLPAGVRFRFEYTQGRP